MLFQIEESYGLSLIDAHHQIDSSGYYVLGDNRDQSVDSRQFGRVAPAAVRCRVAAILASELGSWFTFGRAGWIL